MWPCFDVRLATMFVNKKTKEVVTYWGIISSLFSLVSTFTKRPWSHVLRVLPNLAMRTWTVEEPAKMCYAEKLVRGRVKPWQQEKPQRLLRKCAKCVAYAFQASKAAILNPSEFVTQTICELLRRIAKMNVSFADYIIIWDTRSC